MTEHDHDQAGAGAGSTGRSGRSRPLTMGEIVEAALALTDEGGIGGLTMRRLGRRLGVDPMAIYHHVANRRALVAHMIEHVLAGLHLPDPAAPWDQQVRDWAREYRATMAAHPALIGEAVADPSAIASAAAQVTEPLVAAVERSGQQPKQAVGIAHLVVDYVHGTALSGQAGPENQEAFELALTTIITGAERLATDHRR